MKKNLLYLGLLALLVAGVYLIVRKNKESVFGVDEAGFSVQDTAAIGRIFLAHMDGRSVLLERDGDKGWRVNGDYAVMPSPIRELLRTVNRQRADRPVPANQHNDIVKLLSGSGTKVELYDRSGRRLSVFYVGDETHNFSGTYMLREGAGRPYIVNIPGFSGVLTSRYSPELKDWRDRTVFNIGEEDIESVSVTYADKTPGTSFSIVRGDGDVAVKLDDYPADPGKLNEPRARAYLRFFSSIHCEGYTNGEPNMDSILRNVPERCVIHVKGKNGYDREVRVFWRPLDKRSKNLNTPLEGHPNEFDSDRFYAVMNNGRDTVAIQRFVFEKIFRNGIEFYQEDTPGGDTPAHSHEHVHEHRH